MDTITSLNIAFDDDHSIARRVQVVDAKTGEPIKGVIAADAIAGTVRRFEVENGNLVRNGDTLVIVDDERDIRIEWIVPPVAEVAE